MEYLIILGKTLLFYILLIIILRLMGKREVGELSVFDIVVFFLITELISLAIQTDENIFKAIAPIALILILQLITSILVLKNNKIRELIEGKPAILIKEGIILEEELKKQRYNLDDLLSQIREQGIDDVSSIKFAILEVNGRLSIIRKLESKSIYPFPLIEDGVINFDNLKNINKDKTWLDEAIKKQGFKNYKDIFIFLYEVDKPLIISKKLNDKK